MCVIRENVFHLLVTELDNVADAFARISEVVPEGFIDRCASLPGYMKMRTYLDKIQANILGSSEGDTYVYLLNILLNMGRRDIAFKMIKLRLDT